MMKISQNELANTLGISPTTVSRYENNEISPKEEIIVRTSLAFNISCDYLLGLSPSPNINKEIIKDYEEIKQKAEKYDKFILFFQETVKE